MNTLVSKVMGSARIEFTRDLLPKVTEVLQHIIRGLLELPLAHEASTIVLGDVFQQIAYRGARLQPFSNQGTQEVFDLPLFHKRSLRDPFVYILWQPQRHWHSLANTAHELSLHTPSVARCNITYAESFLCLILNSAGFCLVVNSPFLSQRIVGGPNHEYTAVPAQAESGPAICRMT